MAADTSDNRFRLRRRTGRARPADVAPWIIGSVIIAALFFGRTVLIPIMLAIVLSFLLTPIVAAVRRLRVPRAVAVIIAVLIAIGAVSVTATVIVSQASVLTRDAPAYAERIGVKVAGLSAELHHRFAFLTEKGSGGRGHAATEGARGRATPTRTPTTGIPVEVHEPTPTALQDFQRVVLPVLPPLETAIVVLIVTLFILFRTDDLVDRLIRLWGARDLHRTTAALDDAAVRLGRYFLSQCMVNLVFGTAVWIGLYFIGVPAPGLWGIVVGLLRFVPYVGIVIAALAPLALAAAVDPGWGTALWVGGLYLSVELLMGYVIEPLVYGRSTGLSPVSVIVAALFWAWIWGPIGLLLSTPLTLMLVVLGRHVPAFEMFDVLFGDRPALSPAEMLYHRMLSEQDEAAVEHADLLLEDWSIERYYDEAVFGALLLAMSDCERRLINRAALKRVGTATVAVIDAVAAHDDADDGAIGVPGSVLPGETSRSVLLVPARGPLDDAVAAMLRQLLVRQGCSVRVLNRGDFAQVDWAAFNPEGAHVVAFVGLFDERSGTRVAALADHLRRTLDDVAVVMGVVVDDPAGDMVVEGGSDEPRTTIANLCAMIAGEDNVSRADPAASGAAHDLPILHHEPDRA